MVCILQSMSAIIDSDLIPGEALGDIQPLTDGLSQFFSSISVSTLREDVNTLKSVYYLFSDNGILMDITSGEGDLFEKLQQTQENGETIVNTVINILRSNERTALLVKAITKTVISSISTKVELEDGTEVEITYDSLKDSIGNVVSVKKDDYATTEEYKEAVKDTLDEELKNVGLEVEEEVLDSVADYIEENLSDITEFDDEEFTDVMLHYYDAYLKYLETGEIPEGLPQ